MSKSKQQKMSQEELKLQEMERQYAQLVQLQHGIDKINEEEQLKILEIEREYNEKRRPLTANRAKIIAKIEHFWTHALANHDIISDCIIEDDIPLLNAVENLEITELSKKDKEKNRKGFRIQLTLRDNEFIKDKTIWKDVIIRTASADASATSESGTQEDEDYEFKQSGLQWKDGKRFIKEQQQKSRGSAMDDDEDGDEDMDDALENQTSFFEMFERHLETDRDVCVLIKDEIWVNPVRYYAGSDAIDEDE